MTDVAVIGLGRVGLPLALAFADAGLTVLGVDNDPTRIEALRAGRMPFEEPGAQEVLDRVRDRLTLAERAADAHVATHIVLTLGTPAMSHIEIDLRQIRSVLDDLLPHLREGHAIHLRSTIAPEHHRVRRRLPHQAPRLCDRRRGLRRPRPGAHRVGEVLRGDLDAAVHRRRRRRALRRGRR